MAPGKETLRPVHLRPEAQAFTYDKLEGDQREAFLRILETMHEALQMVESESEERLSRLFMVSGERGTGKTSLVLSLKAFVKNPEKYKTP